MKGKIITLMCASALLSSCHIYKAYDRPEDITTEGLYRDTTAVNDTLASDTANFGNMPWREVFTDPQLQGYIEQALTSSPDIRTAALKVQEAQASLLAAKLAFIPALTLSPQGTVTSWDKGKATQTYSLPVTASWQIDLFGQLLNPKRMAKATLEQTKAYEQNTRVQLIANTANLYYTLLMLDRQLEITEGTANIMKKNTETMQAMKDAGIYGTTEAAVEQSRAAYAQILASLPDIRANIREVETHSASCWANRLIALNAAYWKTSNSRRNSQQVYRCNCCPTVRMSKLPNKHWLLLIITPTQPVPTSIRASRSAVRPDGPTVPVPPLSIPVSFWPAPLLL